MDYHTAKNLNRLNRLESLGQAYFDIGRRTGNMARMARAARFLEAVNAKAMPIVVREATAYRSLSRQDAS